MKNWGGSHGHATGNWRERNERDRPKQSRHGDRLGDAVCNELGICCETRGRVIFQIYKKLEEMKPKKDTTVTQQTSEAQAE